MPLAYMGRTPPGVRGLKFATDGTWADIMPSHPTRGAWIEITFRKALEILDESHPTRGAWIEIGKNTYWVLMSYSRTPPGVRGLKSFCQRHRTAG